MRGIRTTRTRRSFVLLTVLAVLTTGCTGGDEQARKSEFDEALHGGTLRVGVPTFLNSSLTNGVALDPQIDFWADSFELFHCCLVRTLVTYPGLPVEEGGAQLHPDLAASMPRVSPDTLTWTFELKRGLHYAPPFEDREILAADFVRALEREASPALAPADPYLSVIAGFDDFAAGKAEAISGLESPDEHTFVVHLDEPVGDLGHRLTLSYAAPIPEGAAEGHDRDYGRFLVASGPYMLEGSEDRDANAAPSGQTPVSGYVPNERITLVRNPSWRSSTDDLRPAYPDRIEVVLGGSVEKVAQRITAGSLDVMLYSAPAPQLPVPLFEKYVSTPALRDRLLVGSRHFLRYVSMNLAVPPFDDIHVRKALNYVIDKDRLIRIHGGRSAGRVLGHLLLDSLEGNLLRNYDPYGPAHGGNLPAARREMRASRYDEDGDGACDHRACEDVLALTIDASVFPEIGRAIREDVAAVGIDLNLRILPGPDLFEQLGDPANKVPLALSIAWGAGILNPTPIMRDTFSRRGISAFGLNFSLVGATPRQLAKWGYDVRSVPSAETRINACLGLVGPPQLACWAAVDQFLTEEVVPQVPYIEETNTTILSTRVRAANFDESASVAALDRFVLRG